MSRYSLKPLPHRADLFEIAVGWDPGLETYFVMVFGTLEAYGEPDVRLWRGTTLREISTVYALFAVAEGFAEIPAGLMAQLEKDRTAEPSDKKRSIGRIVSELLGYKTPSR